MWNLKLLKSILIPTLGVSAIGTIATVSTSCGCGSENQEDINLDECVGIIANADSTLKMISHHEEPGIIPDLQYSTDGGNSWNEYKKEVKTDTAGQTLMINQGQTLCLKGDNPAGWSSSAVTYSYFAITGDVSISGNVMGLLDNGATSWEGGDITDIPCDCCFYKLFWNSTGITSVSEDFLPATTLAKGCYGSMFNGCNSLTAAPALPATILENDCYECMFIGCSSLTTAPKLPATTLADHCYDSMFQGCSSLTIPPELLATTLASDCYAYMFKNCTSLIIAPELLATSLAKNCYVSMFYCCTSLTTAPELPATTLTDHCYDSMFEGCSALTTAPELPATTLVVGCYNDMFQGCSSLTTAPELPATTLAKSCYGSMFRGCTSLTSAPELLAATLASDCYESMFQSCSSLTLIKIGYTGNYDSTYFNNWVNNVATSGIFYYNGSQTAQDFKLSSGWVKRTTF